LFCLAGKGLLEPPTTLPSKFDPHIFLSTIEGGRTIADFPKKQTIFAQSDSSDAVPFDGQL
jgi:hypothetical protein